MIAPLLAQVEASPEGPSLGGILVGVLVLGLLAFVGARIIAGRGGRKRGL
ncbi:hypothetical protein [Vulgatibacter sp.]